MGIQNLTKEQDKYINELYEYTLGDLYREIHAMIPELERGRYNDLMAIDLFINHYASLIHSGQMTKQNIFKLVMANQLKEILFKREAAEQQRLINFIKERIMN